MKLTVKLGLSIALVAALTLAFVTFDSTPASATPPCPPTECPSNLMGYTYAGTCASDDPSLPCLGWIYTKNGNSCHVSALGGI